MKKLLCSAALAGLVAVAAAPAMAQGDQSALKLDLGGYFRGYVAAVDNDTRAGFDERNVDILRDTEVHFTGETTLDNGLTVGVHVESTADREGMTIDESYMYTSGSWGRVNFGSEDGAAYLLQIAAPSADSNVDGIRQYIRGTNYFISPFNNTVVPGTAGTIANLFSAGGSIVNIAEFSTAASTIADENGGAGTFGGWGTNNGAFLKEDYAQDATRFADKLTYLSPVFNGFQAGVSYTPDVAGNSDGTTGPAGFGYTSSSFGVNYDDVINAFGSAWELAARYEGQFDRFGLTLGAGYTRIELEDERPGVVAGSPAALAGFSVGTVRNAFTDDRDLWNVGTTVTFGGFTFGGLYSEDSRGDIAQDDGATAASYTSDSESQTWVLGVDYTTGPWKVGASYLNREVANMGLNYNAAGAFTGYSDLETDKYAAGVTYTYGPGMTFRGSVHHVQHEVGAVDMDGTSFLLGTQVNF